MFSWSLRRKSVPIQAVVSDDTDASLQRSASRLQRKRSRSLSSKGSLTSLFSSPKKDRLPKPVDPADQIDAFESSNYPQYDPSNPDHNPQSSSASDHSSSMRDSKTSSLGSSRTSASGPKNWLDSIAIKLKAATELFHQESETRTEENKVSPPPSPVRSLRTVRGRSISPKKSVRFRSQTFSSESTSSATPITIPTRIAPSLPALKIPTNDMFMGLKESALQDPIPTGRPQDTPYLKSQAASNYFFQFPNEVDTKIMELASEQKFDLLPEPALPREEKSEQSPTDPFVDAPGILAQVPPTAAHAQQECQIEAATPAETAIDSSLLLTSLSPSKPPQAQSHARFDSESNVTNPFVASSESLHSREATTENRVPPCSEKLDHLDEAIEHEQLEGATATSQDCLTQNASVTPSPWVLESRGERKAGTGMGTESDSEDSDASVRRHRSSGRGLFQTHEDIRQRFRRAKSGEPVDDTSNNTSDLAGAVGNLTSGGIPDPTKHEPVKSNSPLLHRVATKMDSESSSNAASPFASESNGSDTIRRRGAGRAFRFSNTSPGGTATSEVAPTTFGWEGHMLATATPSPARNAVKNDMDQTPSPTAVPLPLSVRPKRASRGTRKWRDQHGWTPFNEAMFAIRLLAFQSPEAKYSVLLNTGGFARFWRMLDLPYETAPLEDTMPLADPDVADLLKYSEQVLRMQHFSNTDDSSSVDAGSFLRKLDQDNSNPSNRNLDSDGSSSAHSLNCSDESCQLCETNHRAQSRKCGIDSMTDGMQSSADLDLSEGDSYPGSPASLREEQSPLRLTPRPYGQSSGPRPIPATRTPTRLNPQLTPTRIASGGFSEGAFSNSSRGSSRYNSPIPIR